MSATFGVSCQAVRDLGLRDADDLTIFRAARDAGTWFFSARIVTSWISCSVEIHPRKCYGLPAVM